MTQTTDEKVSKALAIAYANGFGFQAEGLQDHYLVIAFLHTPAGASESQITQTFRTELATDQMYVDEWLGRVFIACHWRLYNRIPAILNCALRLGYGLTLQNCLRVVYEAGEIFDPLQVEAKFIAHFRSVANESWLQHLSRERREYPYSILGRLQSRYSNLLCEWNWQTPEGKAFCRELRIHLRDAIDKDEAKLNFFEWKDTQAIYREYKLMQYADWWYAPSSIEQGPLDTPICFLCEDRPANTQVIPCLHTVVCKECSDKLKQTPDRGKCVQCRRPIECIVVEGIDKIDAI